MNFLPSQYRSDSKFRLSHNYLPQQFRNRKQIIKEIEKVVSAGDFTLGEIVDDLEFDFAKMLGSKYAIGVGSGTDALFLSLKALGVGVGDEVITSPFTFYATVSAIVATGATPVFCDIGEDFNIDVEKIPTYISHKTKVILPVHWTGRPCAMERILDLAHKTNLHVVEDACHGILAELNGRKVGTFGETGCFSFHPLKNLNVWGDGGIIVTDSTSLAERLRLLRNHGLRDRDQCEVFGFNSRLDSIQAAVAKHMLGKIQKITDKRIFNAHALDAELIKIPQVKLPERRANLKEVFHLYSFKTERRDELRAFLQSRGIDAKIHYARPIHLQPAANYLGYREGDFPISEVSAKETLSLPVHEFVSQRDLELMTSSIREFYE